MAEKDVQALLLNERVRRRRPGDVPYPLDSSTAMLNFDIWNQMFLTTCSGRITLHDFHSIPPSVVLDLGCGGGYWCMEAAKQWPESTVIGFDVKDIQPRLEYLDTHKDLARRVKWVHGNLLDGLPFAPDHFDFVRIVGIGLGVPEDEWQYVLEEISRVMKPGAILEIVEDDLIFPCGRPPTRRRPRPSPISVDLPMTASLPSSSYSIRTTSSTLLSAGSSTLLSAGDPFHFSFDEINQDYTLRRKSNAYFPPDSPPSQSPQTPYSSGRIGSTYIPSPIDIPEEQEVTFEYEPHPQDHHRLKASWDAMLSRRFLAPNINTVLPFYLSSCFDEVQSFPILQVPLPPNSESRNAQPQQSEPTRTSDESEMTSNTHTSDSNGSGPPQARSLRTLSDVHSSSLRRGPSRKPSFPSALLNGGVIQEASSSPFPASPFPAMLLLPNATWTATHLAKVVKCVSACKEAIWAEYQKLYAPDLPPVAKTARPERIMSTTSKSSAREDFERAWGNWENDMIDRMGIRDRIMAELLWAEPPGDRPEWLVWRNNLETLRHTMTADDSSSIPSTQSVKSFHQTQEVCRSMRGFVARKPR